MTRRQRWAATLGLISTPFAYIVVAACVAMKPRRRPRKWDDLS